MNDMLKMTSSQRIRAHARVYGVGAVGLSVAGVAAFFSTIGAATAHAAARPMTAGKAVVTRHERVHGAAQRVARVGAAQQVSAVIAPEASVTPVRSISSGTYVAPAVTRPHSVPVTRAVSPAPSPSAPKPVAVVPKPAPGPKPVASTPPPPTQTHSS